MKRFIDYLEIINEAKKLKTLVPSKKGGMSFLNVKTEFNNIKNQVYDQVNNSFNKIKEKSDVKLYLNALIKAFNKKHEDIEDFKDFKYLFNFFKFQDEKSSILDKTLNSLIMFNNHPGKKLDTNEEFNLSKEILKDITLKDVKDFINEILKKNKLL